jgi:cobalt-precorrin-6B (C15)-methyltransferase
MIFHFVLLSLKKMDKPVFTIPGIPDDYFIRGDVPMTKEEVRVIALSKLRLEPTDHMIDIGAGTGSVSIEAARALPAGQVVAVERSALAIDLIRKNICKFGIENMIITEGAAPEALQNVTGINKVFIGGSGGELHSILDWVSSHTLAGTRLVITAVTLDTLQLARQYLADSVFAIPEIIQVAVTHVVHIGNSDMLKANSPVFIISTQKLK